jgi:hypothetical protein
MKDEEDILEPLEGEEDSLEPAGGGEDLPQPDVGKETSALEKDGSKATATAVDDEGDARQPALVCMIDDDTIVFLDYGGEEDYIAVLEGEGPREAPKKPPAEPRKSRLPLILVFLFMLLGGGGFALWWFVLRGA